MNRAVPAAILTAFVVLVGSATAYAFVHFRAGSTYVVPQAAAAVANPHDAEVALGAVFNVLSQQDAQLDRAVWVKCKAGARAIAHCQLVTRSPEGTACRTAVISYRRYLFELRSFDYIDCRKVKQR